ncbi:hypothetical protein [Floridanema aerugineum]|uniref:Cytoplasmic dynein 2 light intermediate chain 1 n=1 Tax=Floridaenema aerugineum BLCC-F46 TaxID=3153654 RepID=A0ABV4X7N9_9CYAN
MLRSEIIQRLVQAWRSVKQEFLEELENIPLSSEIKERLIQAWKSGKQSFIEDVERMKTEIEEIIRMPLDTKIMMLGTSGTGKTCYMIGMQVYMQTVGTDSGFTITSVKHNQARTIEEQWMKMCEGEGSERWPAGTDVTVGYSFNFNYANKTFAKFNWVDYRGGALDDDEDNEERKSLVEELCTSDCLFLCLSAEYLAKGFTPGAALKARVGVMNALMTEVAAKKNSTPENPFPVAIVVTKADLLDNFNGSIKENAVEVIKKFFKTLFVPGSPWLTGIIGVSLGKELAEKPDSGEIDPIEVHLPVTFGVLCKLIKHANGLAKPKGNWGFLSKIIDTNVEETEIKNRIQQLDLELASVPIYAGNQRITSLLKWAKL